MNTAAIKELIENGSVSLDIEAGITLMISDASFRPGTVRVHLPAPINAAWLKEGQLLDSEPMFRMASVEDYPQRSVYFNERLEENTPFSVTYAFTSAHTFLQPDIKLIDRAAQKSFSFEEIECFSRTHHCGCESYTAFPHDAVSILDVTEDRGICFKEEYKEFLNKLDLKPGNVKNGTAAYTIYRFITESFNKENRTDHNIAFVSMCRMCGIPARWQGGWASLNDTASDSTETPAAAHDWAMVHLLPYGWIYADPKAGAEAFCDYFFGNIDPFMVPTASAPAADLYPAKDYERADKIFNVYGEVELVPDKLGSEGHFEGYGLTHKDFSSQIYIKLINK